MRMVAWVVALTVAIAAATAVGGWWAVPLCGAIAGAASGSARFPGWHGALAGALGWATLLGIMAVREGVGDVADLTAGVLGVPLIGVYALTVGFAALLAGTGATLGRAARDLFSRSPSAPPDVPDSFTTPIEKRGSPRLKEL